MTREEFVKGISIAVQHSATDTTIELLKSRKAPRTEDWVQVMDWYQGLTGVEKELGGRLIRVAVDTAVFGFLCALDGARAIEYGEDKGEIRLTYLNRGIEVSLVGSGGEDLHDIFQRYMQKIRKE